MDAVEGAEMDDAGMPAAPAHTRPGDDGAPTVDTAPLHLPHAAAQCPKCFEELQRDHDWWLARPADARLVGLVVQRDGMPTIKAQRDELARFGVPIEGFRHPAPETLESWEVRLARLFGTLRHGDVLVVTSLHALGRDTDEETRAVAELNRRGIVVKVLSHGDRHLHAAAAELGT